MFGFPLTPKLHTSSFARSDALLGREWSLRVDDLWISRLVDSRRRPLAQIIVDQQAELSTLRSRLVDVEQRLERLEQQST